MRAIALFQAALAVLCLSPWTSTLSAGPPAESPRSAVAEPSPYARSLHQRTGSSAQQRLGGIDGVYKHRIDPNWFADSTRFWYRNDLRNGKKEFVTVTAKTGARRLAFDHTALSQALSEATDHDFDAEMLPFDEIQFSDDGESIRFAASGTRWAYTLANGKLTNKGNAAQSKEDDREQRDRRSGRRGRARQGSGEASPDGRWKAEIRDHNIVIRSNCDDAGPEKEIQLTEDGTEKSKYGLLQWSPDSTTLVAFRIEPGDEKEVFLVESSPGGHGRALLHRRPYPLPGDKFTSYELHLFRVAGDDHQHIRPAVERIEYGFPRLRWKADGRNFFYTHVDRGHQRLRVIDVDSHTGDTFNILEETSETFIWTAHTENLDLELVNWLEASNEIIYVSEQDGWRHLYLVDASQPCEMRQITSGEFVVRGIDRIDEENRQIWFRASGIYPGQDPYFVHYCRVNFDGTKLVVLTEGNGNHGVQFSPDFEYLVDSYSRVDMPPVHELRRTADGKLIALLEKADSNELEQQGFRTPEVFVAKGRDGETDIWGIVVLPNDFDRDQEYPVVEYIYAGPQGSYVPKSFIGRGRLGEIADLGFVVVQIDGMGTANRSKAFHDVCWRNLKDGGFPDRIPWIKAAAKDRPYIDTSRVGIYGGSAGGQNAVAALLFHPEFYDVAVAGCGCHDNRMDKASWNEQWMGYPVGPHYSACSNVDNAYRLEGKLLLILGGMDRNVPPESTRRLVDALIEAGKDFDFVLVPGAGHGMGGKYGARRLRDFFLQHLRGVMPPDRNRAPSTTANEARPANPLGEAGPL